MKIDREKPLDHQSNIFLFEVLEGVLQKRTFWYYCSFGLEIMGEMRKEDGNDRDLTINDNTVTIALNME